MQVVFGKDGGKEEQVQPKLSFVLYIKALRTAKIKLDAC